MRNALPDADAFLPPSRQLLLERCLHALESGPVLLTGDAGIGKSWLAGQLSRRAGMSRWIRIDLTPNDGPSDLYRHLARGLGLTPTGVPTRLDITDLLADRTLDGERFSLVLDEAHNLSLDVWEEVRILLNRLGADDGFAHLLLAGQTALIRRFAARSLAAIESRLAAHLHVRPIDVAEARDWLRDRHPGRDWSPAEVESMHRDSGGNPGRLLRRSRTLQGRVEPQPALAAADPGRVPLPAAMPTQPDRAGFAPTAANRPPLHVADNSIEVGWSADEAEAAEYEDHSSAVPDRATAARALTSTPNPIRAEHSDQAVHDHYAALQAWREWASNQEKRLPPHRSDRDLADEIDEAAAAEAIEATETSLRDRPAVRAEGQQQFAPFSQLFSRIAPVREP